MGERSLSQRTKEDIRLTPLQLSTTNREKVFLNLDNYVMIWMNLVCVTVPYAIIITLAECAHVVSKGLDF